MALLRDEPSAHKITEHLMKQLLGEDLCLRTQDVPDLMAVLELMCRIAFKAMVGAQFEKHVITKAYRYLCNQIDPWARHNELTAEEREKMKHPH